MVLFSIIFFSYAQAFHMAFGKDLVGFKGVWSSALTLFEVMLGNFNLEELR